MAKLKVKGYSEYIDIPNDSARKIKELLFDSENQEMIIEAGRWSGKLKQIAFVVSDEELKQSTDWQQYEQDYHNWRNKMLLLSPIERAKVSGWGSFKLFYYGIYNTNPMEEKWRPLVIDKVTKFYEENPRWVHPSIFIWWELTGAPQNMMFNKDAFRILERVEAQELATIEEEQKRDKREGIVQRTIDKVQGVVESVKSFIKQGEKGLPFIDADDIDVKNLPF